MRFKISIPTLPAAISRSASTVGQKDKPTVLALREIAAGKVGIEILNRIHP